MITCFYDNVFYDIKAFYQNNTTSIQKCLYNFTHVLLLVQKLEHTPRLVAVLNKFVHALHASDTLVFIGMIT